MFSQENKEWKYKVYDLGVNKNLLVESRKNFFDKEFPAVDFLWNEHRLFIFSENNDFRSLFVVTGDSSIHVFFIVKEDGKTWFNFENEDDGQDAFTVKKCHKEFLVDKGFVLSLMQSQMWEMPLVLKLKADETLVPFEFFMSTKMYFGFFNEKKEKKLFYFRDFRGGEKLKRPLNVYDEMFKLLESMPFCRIEGGL